MKKPHYRLEKSGSFVIENYNFAKAFSSFFPGISGLYGIPMWVFYVNRGQCISSFGTKDKDGSILEFFPANQAYNLTPLKGFRTFLSIDSPNAVFYEPFRDNTSLLAAEISNRMIIEPCSLTLEEENPSLGLRVTVAYTTLSEEPFSGLIRSLELRNLSKRPLSGNVIDGLPHISPFGMNAWLQKNMSRTIEAWMTVSNLKKKIPFYSLKVNPEDRPELEQIEKGNIYFSFLASNKVTRLLDVIIDPDLVFGRDGDISFPVNFASSKAFHVPSHQRSGGKTPSAFSHTRFTLKPGASVKIISITGNVSSAEVVNNHVRHFMKAGIFQKMVDRNNQIISRLENRVFTKSSSDQFDYYVRQTFLDNLLRGGFPLSIKTPTKPSIFYIYGRKHGDLERDYNNFNLQPSYFSQGNGAYRDMNQNRRNDIFFNPDVEEHNILTFLNAIQPDGFNPLLINGVTFHIRKKNSLAGILPGFLPRKKDAEKISSFLSSGFTPGDLLLFIEKEKISISRGIKPFINKLLSLSVKEDVILPGEGYWIDHWTYNLDLIENYLSLFPENLLSLLVKINSFTFYDSWNKVVPRSEKYVYVKGKVRQYNSVIHDEDKMNLILSRKREQFKVRIKNGEGDIYRTTLFVKLLTLVANKIASIDPSGTGIEMEANKPGWCDALNNLPGIFGSSSSETAELLRLVIFLGNAIGRLELSDSYCVKLPQEITMFIKKLSSLLHAHLKDKSSKNAYKYWDNSASIKESYRAKVWNGFNGKEGKLSIKEIRKFLLLSSEKLESALSKCVDRATGIPFTYFFHEVIRHRFIHSKGRRALNSKGQLTIKALSFKKTAIPYSLEGPMHFIRIMRDISEKKALYRSIKKSGLYDKKLGMYKVNASLAGMPDELGRSMVFTPGWLENESIWLHMEYKYLLELLRGGLYDEFFIDIKSQLVPFMDPYIYGRSILENSSFIASSAYPDPEIHGTGFVARLSGCTTEFLSIWLRMLIGESPFQFDHRKKELILSFRPALPGWLFTQQESRSRFYFSDTTQTEITVPRDSVSFAFLDNILVTYHNPKRKNTYGKDSVKPELIILKAKGKSAIEINGGVVPSKYAASVRLGKFNRIDIHLG